MATKNSGSMWKLSMSENGWQRFSSTNYDVTEPIMLDAFYPNIMMLEFSNNMLIAAIELLTGR